MASPVVLIWLNIREPTLGRDLTSVMSVEKILLLSQNYISIRDSTLGSNLTNVVSVEKLFAVKSALHQHQRITVERNPISVRCVGEPSIIMHI